MGKLKINMARIRVVIRGNYSMLQKNSQTIDPLNKRVKEIKKLTGLNAKQKDDSTHEEIQRLEFEANMYHDEEAGPYIPAKQILAAICSGAKQNKNGSKVKEAVFLDQKIVPIKYEGPRDMKEMWESGEFHEVHAVKVGQKAVNRCRPRFKEGWEAQFDLKLLMGNGLDVPDIERALDYAGMFKGIGDYRPLYGRFEVIHFQQAT